MTKNLEVSVDNGKYTFTKESSNSRLVITRYGEYWFALQDNDIPCVNAFMAALYELEELKKK